jgi:steroid delta-isomerase-like uncharacterized protein
MSQQNEAVVRRVIEEAWNRGNLAVIDECMTEDCRHEGPMDRFEGRQGARDNVMKYRNAFPDCQLRIDELLSSGDRVVMRFTWSGTNGGSLEGMAPTNRAVKGGGISIMTMRDGRIASEYSQWDALSLLQQLGVVTLPGKARAAGV